MEPFDRGDSVRKPLFSESKEISLGFQLELPGPRKRTPRVYRICDAITEVLVYLMVVFTPWAFGTTQPWSIWTTNVAGCALGGLLTAKWLIRWRTGYKPSRWGTDEADDSQTDRRQRRIARLLTIALAGLTVFLLGYCLASALNARATYWPTERRFDYHDYIKWLPHSYDQASTWNSFWNYLGLACFFWSLRDWLLGKTRGERHEKKGSDRSREEDADPSPADSPAEESGASSPHHRRGFAHYHTLPVRLQRLLWVLCINGALLALEAILQRLSGTNKLLWMIVPRFNVTGDAQFGPYAYRSNAATYINLVWPVCLGFWFLLRKAAIRRHRAGTRVGGGSYVALLPCAVVMAAAPIFSVSRGGAAVALLNIMIATVVLFFAARREGALIRASMLSLFVAILGFSAYLGWKQLQERLQNIFVDNMSDRPQIYTNAYPMTRDFPVFGTGPGTFGTIYQLYKEEKQSWEAYVHDDFLETRITFGWVGFSAALLALGLVWLRWFFRSGIPCSWEFVAFAWLALGGCLFHAKFDFPFQIYSILCLFLLVCSVLFCVSRK